MLLAYHIHLTWNQPTIFKTSPSKLYLIPASSQLPKGCCLNPKEWCIGTPFHPFSTLWTLKDLGIYTLNVAFHIHGLRIYSSSTGLKHHRRLEEVSPLVGPSQHLKDKRQTRWSSLENDSCFSCDNNICVKITVDGWHPASFDSLWFMCNLIMFIKSAWRIRTSEVLRSFSHRDGFTFFWLRDGSQDFTHSTSWLGRSPKQTSCLQRYHYLSVNSEIFTIFHVQTWSKTSVLVFELYCNNWSTLSDT